MSFGPPAASPSRWAAVAAVLALHAAATLALWVGKAVSPPSTPRRVELVLLSPAREQPRAPGLDDPRPRHSVRLDAPALPPLTLPQWAVVHSPPSPPSPPSRSSFPAEPIRLSGAAATVIQALPSVGAQATAVAPVAAAPSQSAERLSCPPVLYPALLRERGIEGAARVRVQLDAQGQPLAVSLAQTSGYRLFDQAALQRAQACRYRPAWSEGQAQAATVEFAVRFLIGDA